LKLRGPWLIFGGSWTVADESNAAGSELAVSSKPRRWSGRLERAAAVASVMITVVALAGLVLSDPPVVDLRSPAPTPAGPAEERGDPVLAQRLADEAARTSDGQVRLRLLLAARVVAPDRATHRIALAGAILGDVSAVGVVSARLDGGPVDYAAINADASFLVTSAAAGAKIWRTTSIGEAPRIHLARDVAGRVSGAAGGGLLIRSSFVLVRDGGVSAWRTVDGAAPQVLGQLSAEPGPVAVTGDGTTAVTVAGTTATLWDIGGFEPVARVSLSYDTPVTVAAFAARADAVLMLVAGHADGVTVDTISLESSQSTRRVLSGAAVGAVALSGDGSTVAALDPGGNLSVWSARSAEGAQPTGVAVGAAGAGPHRLWLSPSGDYAVLADTVGAPVLWSLADRTRPARLAALDFGRDPAVPAMVSVDGRTVVAIGRDDVVSMWNVGPIADVLVEPIGLACQLVDMTEQQWSQMVASAFANPCAAPTLPTLRVDHQPSPSSR
jgi:hypothetical protein